MAPCGCRLSNAWEQLGHTAYGPTVAGHGKDVPKNVTHAESTRSIVEFIVDTDLTDFILVGHGYAGTLISKVVEVVPERVRRLVFCRPRSTLRFRPHLDRPGGTTATKGTTGTVDLAEEDHDVVWVRSCRL